MTSLPRRISGIASDCIGLREVVHGTPAFSFQSGDARSLANAICDWSEEPRKAEFRGYATAAAVRYDVRNTAEGLKGLYDRAVKSKTSERAR